MLAYPASYLIWSRCFACKSGDLWSFYQPPYGLMSMDLVEHYSSSGLTPEEGWKRQESVPGLLFCPLIWVDDTLTGRAYLPTFRGIVDFN